MHKPLLDPAHPKIEILDPAQPMRQPNPCIVWIIRMQFAVDKANNQCKICIRRVSVSCVIQSLKCH